jgi:hypothetical protein
MALKEAATGNLDCPWRLKLNRMSINCAKHNAGLRTSIYCIHVYINDAQLLYSQLCSSFSLFLAFFSAKQTFHTLISIVGTVDKISTFNNLVQTISRTRCHYLGIKCSRKPRPRKTVLNSGKRFPVNQYQASGKSGSCPPGLAPAAPAPNAGEVTQQ